MPLYRWTDPATVRRADSSPRRLVDGRMRFQTREGLWWMVHEELPADLPAGGAAGAVAGARGIGALVFESDTMRHRVRDYPANWATLSTEALEELVVAP